MEESRAESFLRMIRRSERGKLKIYLGYAAGVGKTYQMLKESHQLIQDGVDVVAGLVETHGRVETEALLEGLELIPRKKFTYHGIDILEMDVDAIIERNPAVVLVDELAHTNVPGSRNNKRYQEVEDIISAGIHVISTLNIQHLESLYETVERATGIKVKERIPDRVVAEADQIVNVDITTEDLRRRLKEGKVYTTERIETALQRFFRLSNLEQLRELTLRELAAQIDSKRRQPYMGDIPSSPDQVMVCLSSRGANSEALLRYASRLAGRLNRNWYALYVQTSNERPSHIDARTQRLLSNTLDLAQQLGATVFTYKGDDIVKVILQVAKEYRVGHIVIGTPDRKLPFWQRMLGEVGVVERLVTESSGITIVVVDTKPLSTGESSRKTIELFNDVIQNAALNKNSSADLKKYFKNMPVLIWHNPIEKDRAIRELLDQCFSKDDKLYETAWESLEQREKQGGTYVSEDILIPHSRIEELPQPLIAVGIAEERILDKDNGIEPKIIFLLISPFDPPEYHTEMLAMISEICRNEKSITKMFNAGSASEIRDLIKSSFNSIK